MIRILILILLPVLGFTQKPNIIFILADDMGNGDMSRNDGTYDTPFLDTLAANSAYFDRFYVYPACTPSRAAFLTGRYPFRYGLHEWVIARYDSTSVVPSERKYFLPRKLKEEGYTTAIVGKWHMGHVYPEHLPENNGFDYSFNLAYGNLDYYSWKHGGMLDVHENGQAQFTDSTYFTDKIAEKCEAFLENIASCSDSPFFLYVPHFAPHIASPDAPVAVQIPEDSLVNAPTWLTSDQKRYWVMMRQLDYAVERVYDKMVELGLDQNTHFIFSSDNGGNANYDALNTPYRGAKADLLEGGIRVPLIWQGPGVDTTTIITPCHISDLWPTFVNGIAESSEPTDSIDGVNILPLLSGGSIDERTFLIHWLPNNTANDEYAVIKGDYKLCKNCDGVGSALYNVVEDPGETSDSSGTYTALTAELEAFINSLSSEVVNNRNVTSSDFSAPVGFDTTVGVWADPKAFYDTTYYWYRGQ
jgi:arylsulfatase A-like enzyme